ncbi:MAG TPA: malate synthase A [Gemmatimonadaceae bacterium]|nr:malate synthase A [Gemmatimonadaceae bacterium]
MSLRTAEAVEVRGRATDDSARVLTPGAVAFLASLEREFGARRRELLARRRQRQAELDAGALPTLLPETSAVRAGDWRVASAPADLEDRRVEITGPVDRKMVINALNSGASCYMADFEDACSPTWENLIAGQGNMIDAVRRTISLTQAGGKSYSLAERTATLLVRPRGWHLDEAHVLVDGRPMSGSLFDFGLFFFHNARELLARGSGPYFYLPKMQSHLEARLWNDVFVFAQQALGVPRGSVRATCLIETIHAAFEMEEILYELREHAAGLNAGRWDYLFSIIKAFGRRGDFILPDRAQLTMAVPFMRAYARLLVGTCHRRGAHAIGGMAAFIPNRRDPEATARALARVDEDKLREAGDGFDGSWVAHPDLVAPVRAVFDGALGPRPHQKDRGLDHRVDARELLDARIEGGAVTDAGVRTNVAVALEYLETWLRGTGAVAIHDLMEDAATAEISRSQLWQWRHHGVAVAGAPFTADRYREMRDRELPPLKAARGSAPSRYAEAAELLDALVLGDEFTEFLTIPGYRVLIRDRAHEERVG